MAIAKLFALKQTQLQAVCGMDNRKQAEVFYFLCGPVK